MLHFDAIVIGAGPAGSLAAQQLARCGTKVLLVEKQAFPREKVCGCCVNEKAVIAIHSAGLGEQLSALNPIHLKKLRLRAGGGGGNESGFDLPATITVSRAKLDAMLVAAAISAGAKFRDESAARVIQRHRGGKWEVSIKTKAGDCETALALVIIAADGLGGASLSSLPGFAINTSRKSYLGLQAFLQTDQAPDDQLLMHCGKHGYVGCAPLGDGRLNLAAAVDPRAVKQIGPGQTCEKILSEAGATHLAKHARELRWRGTALLSKRRKLIAQDGLYVVGDAAGYVEPFTGEGIGWALRGGTAVAKIAMDQLTALPGDHAARWSKRYTRELASEQRRCHWLTTALRSPLLAQVGIRLATRRPSVVRQIWPGLIASHALRKDTT